MANDPWLPILTYRAAPLAQAEIYERFTTPGRAVYNPPTSLRGCVPRPSTKTHARTDKRIPPGVLCKRRGILYFAGGLARII